MKRIFHGLIYIFITFLFFISFPAAFIIYGHKKYWIVSEVDFDARDNGIHLFKYIRSNHPETNIAFLISKNNPSFKMVKEIGETIEPHSFKHMLVFIAAKAKISTAVHGCSPSWYVTKYLLRHHGTGKNIALKHGVFKNLHPNYFKENAHLDLICCGGKPEFDFINKEFGYQNGVARYTGLARFDALHDLKRDKEIFVMPTWRRWLDNIDNISEFEKTDFYINWFRLLSDSKFLKLVKDNHFRICFYVHPKLNRFIGSFKTKESMVTFFNSKNGDSVQDHLKKASILITDFSSVFFDFAYMRKPIIYFQFDEKQYFGSHYKKAYFDYRDDGFGPVTQDIDDVINETEKIIKNNGTMVKKFYQRATDFFPLCDANNCERIFAAISEVISK